MHQELKELQRICEELRFSKLTESPEAVFELRRDHGVSLLSQVSFPEKAASHKRPHW
jgi:hypothetical protein